MKGQNKGKGNIIERDDWQTPQKMWIELNNQYGFTTDCCSSKENTKCEHYYTINKPFEKFGEQLGICWMNPPFSKSKEMFEHFFKVVSKGIAIFRCDNMETKVWQNILNKSDWIHIYDKRINYEGKKGNGAVFGSALIGIGLPPPINLGGVTMQIVRTT